MLHFIHDTGTALSLQHSVTLERHIQQVETILHSSDVIISGQEEQHLVTQLVLHFVEDTHVVIFHSLLDDPGIEGAGGQQGFHWSASAGWVLSIDLISEGTGFFLSIYEILTLLYYIDLDIHLLLLG